MRNIYIPLVVTISAIFFGLDAYSQSIPWTFRNTGVNATLVVNSTIGTTINGRNFQNGDAIGVFYTRSGSLYSGGYSVWNGSNLAITAWGNDVNPQTSTQKDGFDANEVYTVKVWDSQDLRELSAIATFTDFNSNSTSGVYQVNSFLRIATLDITTPFLSSPSSAATDIVLDPTLSWNTVSGASYYTVQVSTDMNFGSFVTNTTTASTSLQLSGLQKDTKYYWRVSSTVSGSTSSNSHVWDFSTISFLPVPTSWSNIASTPDSHRVIIPQTAIVKFKSRTFQTGDALGVFYSSSSTLISGGHVVLDGNNSNTILAARGDNSGTTVKDGFSTSEEFSFMLWDGQLGTAANVTVNFASVTTSNVFAVNGRSTIEAIYEKDTIALVAPANSGTDSTLVPTLMWRSFLGASQYEYQISTSSDFSTTVYSGMTSGDTTFTIPARLATSTQYFWRIRAKIVGSVNTITEPWSNAWSFTTIPYIPAPSSWNFTGNTGSSNAIVVPMSIAPRFRTRTVTNGDAIGVFFSTNNTMQSAGFGVWQGSNLTFTAWGDNTGTSTKEGFTNGEKFTVKVWDGALGVEHTVIARFTSDAQGLFTASSTSTMTSLQPIDTLKIPLVNRFRMISSNLQPIDATLDELTRSLRTGDGSSAAATNLTQLKNSAGQAYVPAAPLNAIGNFSVTDGYLVEMLAIDTLVIIGDRVNPTANQITISSSSTVFVPVLNNTAISPDNLFTSAVSANIQTVESNGNGVYLPANSVYNETGTPTNYGINTLNIGEAYKVTTGPTTATVLSYPANSASRSFVIDNPYSNHEFVYDTKYGASENSQVLLVNASVPDGSELLARNQNGEIVGIAAVYNKKAAIIVYGDRTSTETVDGALLDEKITIDIYNSVSDIVMKSDIFSVENRIDGEFYQDLQYKPNAVRQVELTQVESNKADMQSIVSPNPATSNFTYSYALTEDSNVLVELYDTRGQKIRTLINNDFISAGSQTVNYSVDGISSGTYFIRLSANGVLLHTTLMQVSK